MPGSRANQTGMGTRNENGATNVQAATNRTRLRSSYFARQPATRQVTTRPTPLASSSKKWRSGLPCIFQRIQIINPSKGESPSHSRETTSTRMMDIKIILLLRVAINRTYRTILHSHHRCKKKHSIFYFIFLLLGNDTRDVFISMVTYNKHVFICTFNTNGAIPPI